MDVDLKSRRIKQITNKKRKLFEQYKLNLFERVYMKPRENDLRDRIPHT